MSEIAIPKQEEIDCPFCKRGKIHITVIPEHYNTNVARAFGKTKRIPVYNPERLIVNNACPSCGKSKGEIKEILESGKKIMTHEERIAMFKKRGLPLVLGSKK